MEARHIRKSIGVICLTILALVLIGAGSERQASPERSIQTVYVDLDRLEKLHPAWGQLGQVRALDERSELVSQVSAATVHDLREERPAAISGAPDVSRKELQRKLSEDAGDQLAPVEALLTSSARERVEARRRELTGELTRELTERKMQIEREIAARLRTMREEWGMLRVNERLHSIAAQRRSVLDGHEKTGAPDEVDVYDEQARAQEEGRAAAENDVRTKAFAELSSFEERRREEIGRELEKIVSAEDYQVAGQISGYRARLMQIVNGAGFGDLPTRIAGEKFATPEQAQLSMSNFQSRGRTEANVGAALLTRRRNRLARRIREDTERTVMRIAAQRNLKPVFSNSAGRVDCTEYFARLIADPSRLGNVLSGPSTIRQGSGLRTGPG